jgi:hypothetical protein
MFDSGNGSGVESSTATGPASGSDRCDGVKLAELKKVYQIRTSDIGREEEDGVTGRV